MSSHETAYSETTLAAANDTLATAIQEVLQKDKYAARRAHQIHPHLRLKELNYVKNGDIAFVGFRRLRASFDSKIDRMQTSLDIAVGTMSDVRDAVIVLTSKGNSTTVKPVRRGSTKSGS